MNLAKILKICLLSLEKVQIIGREETGSSSESKSLEKGESIAEMNNENKSIQRSTSIPEKIKSLHDKLRKLVFSKKDNISAQDDNSPTDQDIPDDQATDTPSPGMCHHSYV